MAFVSEGFFGVVTLKDAADVATTITYELTAATIAAAITDMASIVALLAPITQLQIQKYDVKQKFGNDAYSVGSGNAKVKGVVSGPILNDPTETGVFQFPDPDVGVLGTPGTPGYNIIDLASVDMAGYGSIYQTGGLSYLSDTERLLSLASGKRVTRGSNNP